MKRGRPNKTKCTEEQHRSMAKQDLEAFLWKMRLPERRERRRPEVSMMSSFEGFIEVLDQTFFPTRRGAAL